MPKNILSAGVIGVGSIGKNHARVYSELPNTKLVAIYDQDKKSAKEIAQKYNCEVAENINDFLEKIELVSIATPTQSHYEIASKALSANVHCLIEKPITNNSKQAKELIEIAKKNNLILQVGHIERFNPILRKLEKILNAPKFIEVHRLSPFPGRSVDVGVVLDLMIHDLEIVLHLVKSELVSFDSVGIPVLTKSEDIANTRLRFANGCVANITASRISPEKMRKIRLFQEDCYISLDYQAQEGKIFRKKFGTIIKKQVKSSKEEPLKNELQTFSEAVNFAKDNKHLDESKGVSGTQATKALQLAMQITEQIQHGGEM